ncbi:MAG TPA: hypothetical protein DF712_14030, partial [Balneola sp.]|nr:hypothetical protein [Balneola sp.]
EFRLVPYPGNLAKLDFTNKNVRLIHQHAASNSDDPVLDEIETKINNEDVTVVYSGRLVELTSNLMSNPEYYLGNAGGAPTAPGTVVRMHTDRSTPFVPDAHYFTQMSTDFNNYRKVEKIWEPFDSFNPNANRFVGLNYILDDELIFSTSLDWEPSDAEIEMDINFLEVAWRNDWIIQADNGDWYGPGKARGDKNGKYNLSEYRRTTDLSKIFQNEIETTAIPESVSEGATGLTLDVTVYNNPPYYTATFRVNKGGQNYEVGDAITVAAPTPDDPPNDPRRFYLEITEVENRSQSLVNDGAWPEKVGDQIGRNLNPYDAISDYVVFDGENASHLSEPEHELTYVNELIEMEEDNPMPYTQMAIAGIRMNSSTEWNSFQELSAYIKKGIKVKRLIKSGTSSSNLFPEIAYHLLTDNINGAGDLIGATSIDEDSMELAARFCEANKFFWDGVITESQNLREFIYEQASYCFLDFTIIGGRFALKPSVPYKTKYQIHHGAKPEIKALFTDGNTKDLKVSFLTPEERQLFQAKVIYREEDENGFAETKVFESRLSSAQGGSSKDPYEVFDMSIFCTNQQHARDFARFALKVRKDVDHGIKFTTTPQSAMHLEPGQYFRYYSESTHTDRFANGVITDDGTIQTQLDLTAGTTYDVYYWKPADDSFNEVKKAQIKILDNGKAPDTFRGSVFTIAQTNASDRVYKLESLVYGEEGFVEVAGSYQPLTSTGSLAILDWDDDYFEETPE